MAIHEPIIQLKKGVTHLHKVIDKVHMWGSQKFERIDLGGQISLEEHITSQERELQELSDAAQDFYDFLKKKEILTQKQKNQIVEYEGTQPNFNSLKERLQYLRDKKFRILIMKGKTKGQVVPKKRRVHIMKLEDEPDE